MAKLIIKLINSVAEVVNEDREIGDRLQVCFVPNFNVSIGELIYPAADLSEQISMAGMEASGTGNMKLALNGALTIGTLDGANIEIGEEVGDDNIFIFGLTAAEVQKIRAEGSYDPWQYYTDNPVIKRVVDALDADLFCADQPGLFKPVRDAIMNPHDEYLHLADLQAYINAQERAEACFKERSVWLEKTILNVARIGKFSSDRTIAEYAQEVWKAKPCL
jgi:starch phosphorylase